MPLIVQSTKQTTTSFNLSIIKSHMQTATKRTATLTETKVAIVSMYQNGTTAKLSPQAQKAAQALANYIYVNKESKKFAFVLGKDHQDQHLLLLTIANHPAKPKGNASLQRAINQAPASTQQQEDLSLVKQLSWVTSALQQVEFGILFWIYQHRLSSQEAIAGTSTVPATITAVNFQRVKTPQEQLQDLVQSAIQNLVASNFTTGINKAQIVSASKLNKDHVISDIKKQINNRDVQALILPGDITITPDNTAQTITIVIHHHGPSKTITIVGFISIKDYLDQLLNVIPSLGGALVIPEGITSTQFDAYVQAMGDVLNEKGEVVMNKFAEKYRTKITSLIIPHSFTTIGPWFQHFNKIILLRIPNSVTTIGEYAFSFAPLTSLRIPNSVTTIGNYAFEKALLTSLRIPNLVTTIGTNAFAYSPLTTLTLGEALQIIGDRAFQSTRLRSLRIPNAVTTIGNYAFQLARLTSLSLGDHLKTIGNGAFANAELTSLRIPDSVTAIRDFAFLRSPLTIITIFDDVKLGGRAFRNPKIVKRIPRSTS